MEKKRMSLQNPIIWIILSAVFSALPISDPFVFFLSWVSFAPFFCAILKKAGQGKWHHAFGRGLLFGFVYHVCIYFWFCALYPMGYTGLSKFVAVIIVLLAWFGISLAHGLLYVIPTLLCHFASKKVKSKTFLVFLAVLGILIAQKITSFSELAFPWVRASLGQYRVPLLIQSASLFGMDGLDFILLSVSALVALYLLSESAKRKAYLFAALFVFLGNALFGGIYLLLPESGNSIQVSCVQGCVMPEDKWDGKETAYTTLLNLTMSSSPGKSDLIVWPETAIPQNLYRYPIFIEAYQEICEIADASMITGCFYKLDGVTSNSAILVTADSVSEPFSKRQLVPFGEKVPFRPFFDLLFPFLGDINMTSSDLAQGEGSMIMHDRFGSYGAIICYESTFPHLCRESVLDGAQMLVVVTNDSWYKDSAGVRQHLAHSVFRSVENGRSVARCANSGISALIDSHGRIVEELGPLEQGVIRGEIAFSDRTTLYTLVGDVFLPIFGLSMAAWFFFLVFQKKRINYDGEN